jgi:hypothetical protein
MAHAPAEPQKWFKPILPPQPVVPLIADIDDDDLRADLHDWSSDQGQPQTPEGIAWVENYNRQYEAHLAWIGDQVKQKYVQWPAAWADAVIASGAPK